MASSKKLRVTPKIHEDKTPENSPSKIGRFQVSPAASQKKSRPFETFITYFVEEENGVKVSYRSSIEKNPATVTLWDFKAILPEEYQSKYGYKFQNGGLKEEFASLNYQEIINNHSILPLVSDNLVVAHIFPKLNSKLTRINCTLLEQDRSYTFKKLVRKPSCDVTLGDFKATLPEKYQNFKHFFEDKKFVRNEITDDISTLPTNIKDEIECYLMEQCSGEPFSSGDSLDGGKNHVKMTKRFHDFFKSWKNRLFSNANPQSTPTPRRISTGNH